MKRAFVVTIEMDETMPVEQAAAQIEDAVDNFFDVLSVNAWDAPSQSEQTIAPAVSFPAL